MKFSVLCFVFLIFFVVSSAARGMMGGFGDYQKATADEQEILDSVRDSVEKELHHHFSSFEAVSYTTQVVAGINYIMVVNTGEEYLHVKIAKPLPYRNEPPFLMSVRRGVTAQTPIDPQLM
jgi:cystatin-A/B